MTKNSVSIVIPVYNAEPFLTEALDSVFRQNFPIHQTIVVDDGSSDGSANTAKRTAKVELLSQKNLGAAAARNRGIEAASGDLLAFLDADDLWAPEKLQIQTQVLAQEPELDMVFGQVRQFLSPELSETERFNLQCPEGTMPGYVPGTLLIRRSTFLQVGPFDPGLRAGEFMEWFDRARGKDLKFRVLPDVLLFRRIHRNNLGRRARNLRQDYLRAVKASLDRRRKNGQV